jgi:methylglutamate dehydrogenase subunit D
VPDLLAASGLEHIRSDTRFRHAKATAQVRARLRNDLALASVIARAGKVQALSHRLREGLGLELPLRPRRVVNGAVSVTWAGPEHWLVATESGPPESFEESLRVSLVGLASVTGQSDGRTVVHVSGAMMRRTLAKIIPIDLDPRSFLPGDVALTVASHINVHFWLTDEGAAFEFAVFRSFAPAFIEQLAEASEEFGFTFE